MNKPIRKPKVSTLADFHTRGLINRWFGNLRLLAVAYPRRGEKTISRVICRTICAGGHEQRVEWWKLRDGTRRTPCLECGDPLERDATQLSDERILRGVAALSPERRRLFEAMINSRWRIPGQQDTTRRELLHDAYTYARDIADPITELRELNAPIPDSSINYASPIAAAMRTMEAA